MRLYVVHYHLRPGGVRRVIESLAPEIVRRLRAERLVLVTGEPPEPAWSARLRSAAGVPVEIRTQPAMGYVAEQRDGLRGLRARLREGVDIALADAGQGDVIWFHNPMIGRNHAAVRAVAACAAERGATLALHHHDFWMDGRWARWADLRRCGVRSAAAAAAALATGRAPVVHAAINGRDADTLRRRLGRRTLHLPNPLSAASPLPPPEIRAARGWLRAAAGGDGPLWVAPCRLLRRKNLAEALLLMRWLDPAARLLTTAGPSSEAEVPYADALAAAARRHRWPLRLAVMTRHPRGAPPIEAVLAGADVLAMTSIQEGFGLPYLEAATAGRPLVCRLLRHVTADLERLGLRFPTGYDDLLVPADAFGAAAERRRQMRRFDAWRAALPPFARQWARPPVFTEHRRARSVAFSRLTLTAQIEVLAQPADATRSAVAALNPRIAEWAARWRTDGPLAMACPARLARGLAPGRIARLWSDAVRTAVPAARSFDPVALQSDLVRRSLAFACNHPLLWSART